MKNLVRQKRIDRSWSQEELANKLGVSRQTVISIEKGRFDPSLPLAFHMARLLEAALEELFLYEDTAGMKLT